MKVSASITVIGTALTLVIAGGAAYQSTQSSCIIGVSGTNASVTVRGLGAQAVCRTAVKEERGWVYLRDEGPTEPVLCEVDQHHRRYVVRDAGILMLVGRGLCAALMQSDSL